jgi:hypothetical protein
MKKNSFWFYIVTFSVFFLLISPTFLSQGMFFDGTIYSTIAKNFALNNWSFWIPHYTTTFNDVFLWTSSIINVASFKVFNSFGKLFVSR